MNSKSGKVFDLLISGEPMDEPIVSSGPFVMNAEAEIHQAHKAFRNGRFGQE